MRRLIAGSHRKGEQVTTYTIEDASFVVSEMNFAQTILLHVGINNLKSQPAEEVLSQFSDLVNLACTKSGNVVIYHFLHLQEQNILTTEFKISTLLLNLTLRD